MSTLRSQKKGEHPEVHAKMHMEKGVLQLVPYSSVLTLQPPGISELKLVYTHQHQSNICVYRDTNICIYITIHGFEVAMYCYHLGINKRLIYIYIYIYIYVYAMIY